MALIALLEITSTTNGTILCTDISAYGGANSARSAVTVNFEVTRKRTSNGGGDASIAVTYDEDTVSQIEVPVKDGWYQVTMTIVDGINTTYAVRDVFVLTDISVCRDAKLNTFVCDCCDNAREMNDFLKIDTVYRAMTELVAAQRYRDAECMLMGAQPLCSGVQDCGGC